MDGPVAPKRDPKWRERKRQENMIIAGVSVGSVGDSEIVADYYDPETGANLSEPVWRW
jgi:hypothetical protein